MVVDHIQDHVQAQIGGGLHHFTEFPYPGHAVGIRGIAALGNGVVHRVIAPVEAVEATKSAIQRLGIAGCRVEGCQDRADGVATAAEARIVRCGFVRQVAQFAEVVVDIDHLGRVFVDRCDIEGRQQVEVGDAGVRQACQVSDAIAGGFRKGGVLAPVGSCNGFVGGAEIANMGFIHHDILGCLQCRWGQAVPVGRFQVAVSQVDDLRIHAIFGKAQGIGVRCHGGFDGIGTGVVDRHLILVELTVDIRGVAGMPPDTVIPGHVYRIAAHHAAVGIEHVQAQALGRWGPNLKPGIGTANGCAQSAVIGIEIVEHTRDLKAGSRYQLIIAIISAGNQLAAQSVHFGLTVCVHAVGRPARKMGEGLFQLWREGGCAQRNNGAPVQGFIGVIDSDAGASVISKFDSGCRGGVGKDERIGIQPVSLGAVDGQFLGFDRVGGEQLTAADRENAIAQGTKVPALIIITQVFLIALVHDEVHAVAAVAHGNDVIGAVGVVHAAGGVWVGPLGRHAFRQAIATGCGVVPEMEPPAVIVTGGAFVIEDGFVVAGFQQGGGVPASAVAGIGR